MRCITIALLLLVGCGTVAGLEPIPDKLVVLTFDDSAKSHFTIVRPVLIRYGFGATFFITEGFDFKDNKRDYMTWDEIAQLHKDGFEIGNHTRDHLNIDAGNIDRVADQLEAINQQCERYGIPKTTTFAWPGNSTEPKAFEMLRKAGIRFARRGGSPERPYENGEGFAFEPGFDHPLLLPTAGDARPTWMLEDFIAAVTQAKHGKIAILQFHGAPDTAHAWVSTSRDRFEGYMKYLALNDYRVIAMRDLQRYVDFNNEPSDHLGVIEDRKQAIENDQARTNFRTPQSEADSRLWLENMVVHHRYSIAEVGAATGLSNQEISDALARFELTDKTPEPHKAGDLLTVLPFPGGRHPRIGFRDGCIRPQRETKVSIFTPWKNGGYVVADVPEAIWTEREGKDELLYLAHKHIPTMWTKMGVQLEPLEWERKLDGSLASIRTLPNKVTFGCQVVPQASGVQMKMWITNDGDVTLRGLRVQNCVMLGHAVGFESQTNANKIVRDPFVACHNSDKSKWIITRWEPALRVWSNPSCPCMHSDPQFPDCEPGQTQRISGQVWFYEGKDLFAELDKLAGLKN